MIPAPGHYMLFSDFMPVGGGPQMIASPLVTAAWDGDIVSSSPNLKADTSFVKTANGVTVELQIDPSKVIAGEEADVPIHFVASQDRRAGTVAALSRASPRHMLSEDLPSTAAHHPVNARRHRRHLGGGPYLTSTRCSPNRGLPHWLQFQRNTFVDGAVYGASVALWRDACRAVATLTARSCREGGVAAQ